MDGHTGADGTRGTSGPVAHLRGLRKPSPHRGAVHGPSSDRHPPRGRALLTAVALPLLPAAPLLAATWVAVSAHGVASAPGVPPLAASLADPTPAVTVFAGLTLAALLGGLPTAVSAGLLVCGGALLGRDVPVRAAWRRALRRVPTTLALLVPTGALVGLLVREALRLAAEGAWFALAAATVAALAVLVLLALALPTAVLVDLPPWRALAEAGRIVRKRRTAHLAAPTLAALPSPGHADPADYSDDPVPGPVLTCLLALVPLAATGLLWSGPQVPQAPQAPQHVAATGPAENRATVQIEEEDGTTHLFDVGPHGLREVGCAPDCPYGALPHDRGGDRSHARVGGHVVGAYWRTDPDHGSDTLYLRVCEAMDSCDDGVDPAAAASAQGSPEGGPKWWEKLLGSRVEVFGDGTARVLGCANADCPKWGESAPTGHARAGTVPDLPRKAGNRSGIVTVEIDGPDTMRLVVLACGGTGCDEAGSRA